MNNYPNSRKNLVRWHKEHKHPVDDCPHCENDRLRDVVEKAQTFISAASCPLLQQFKGVRYDKLKTALKELGYKNVS